MKTFIKSLIIPFVVSLFLLPSVSFAQVTDVVDDGDVSCVSLEHNLQYRPRSTDLNSGGEVTDLQEFLKDEINYKGAVSGSFGPLTQLAVKTFQRKAYTNVLASDIDPVLVPSASARQQLADSGFRISSTGNVGLITRAKIKYLSCTRNTGKITSTSPSFEYVGTNAGSVGTVGVPGKFIVEKNTTACLPNSGYSIDFGDGEREGVDGNYINYTNDGANYLPGPNGQRPCGGYFAIHAYKQAGTYTAKLNKTVYNTCQSTPTTVCAAWAAREEVVGTLTVVISADVVAQPKAPVVLSPNGGETWPAGSTQTITWKPAIIPSPACATGANGAYCDPRPTSYNVTLRQKLELPQCTTGNCPNYMPPLPIVVASNVSGTSYAFTIASTEQMHPITGPNLISVGPGSYTVEVCVVGESLCDSSNGTITVPSSIIGCTREVKMCSDGSYVGRTGQSCEFAACPSTPIAPVVLSPNGGETWPAGSTQTITWKESVIPRPECPSGMQCAAPAPSIYKISLIPQNIVQCVTTPCYAVDGIPVNVATAVTGSSYTFNLASNSLIGTGAYKVEVCDMNIGLCDSSNTYFKIVSPVLAYCSYPAPPIGCTYVRGANYNSTTSCGMELSCTPVYGSSGTVRGVSTVCVDLPRNMHRGTENNNVKSLQTFLVKKGLFIQDISGFYGDDTISAVRDYQLSKNLPVTGMVYDFTRLAIKQDSCY